MSSLARKLDLTRCTRCPAEVGDGESLCGRCKVERRETARRLRARRRDAGLCRFCGQPGPARCDVCKIRQGRIPQRGRLTTGDIQGDSQWRPDSSGWRRYRGQGRRGPRPVAVVVDQAMAMAQEQIERARVGWQWAGGPGGQALPAIQREAAREAAAAEVDLAIRMAIEAAARIRGIDPDRAGVDDADGEPLIYPRMSALEIAEAAHHGSMIYAAPPDGIRTDSEDDATQVARARRPPPKPPDLSPLWAALAARGLAMVEEGVYWWRVVGDIQGDSQSRPRGDSRRR